MYTVKEFEFIDNLLRNSLNNDYTYEKLCYSRNFDYGLYEKLFTDINKEPYKLIELHDTSFTVTTLGRQVAIEGFKKYLESTNSEQELDKSIKILTLEDLKKSNLRSRNAFILSILAIVVSIIFGILNYSKPEKPDNDINANINNTQNEKILTNKPIDSVEENILSKDSIINPNTFSAEIISDSSKHNSKDLNEKQLVEN